MLYLYDALYNVKEETTIEFLQGLFKITEEEIHRLKEAKKPHKSRWYIIDNTIKKNEIHAFQNSYKNRDELWRELKGSNGLYQISNYGRFKKFDEKNPKGIIVRTRAKLNIPKTKLGDTNTWDKKVIRNKRRYVTLKIDGKEKEFLVARLVAEHFLGEAYQKGFNINDYCVLHKNNILYEDYFGNLYFSKKEVENKNVYKNRKANLSVVCLNTGKELGPFTSINRAAKELGCWTTQICDILNKNKENCVSKKYSIRYLKDELNDCCGF